MFVRGGRKLTTLTNILISLFKNPQGKTCVRNMCFDIFIYFLLLVVVFIYFSSLWEPSNHVQNLQCASKKVWLVNACNYYYYSSPHRAQRFFVSVFQNRAIKPWANILKVLTFAKNRMSVRSFAVSSNNTTANTCWHRCFWNSETKFWALWGLE